NDGDIDALSENGDAYGILDLSGTLTDITNFGRIQAVGGTENDDTSILSRAIDVSTNTSGVSIANTAPAVFDDDLNDDGTIDVTLADFGIINGDVVTGSGDDTFFSNAGPVVGDLILSDGNDTVTFQQEAILNGSIDVGSGNDTVTFNNATITSDVNFGAGTDVFEILNGTSWSGSFSSTGDLSVRSNSSSVSLTDASNASLSNLTVENGSTLLFDISASTDSAPRIVASDTVTISDDSSIDVAFQTGFTGTIESTLIQASTLNINLAEVGLVGEGGSSFLVASSLGLAQDDPNALVLTRRRKSGDEVGIFTEEQAAFEAAITGIETDTELTQEIYALSTQDDFLDAYRQLLPPTIDMPLIAARAQTDTIGSIINDRTNLTGEGRSNSARFWLQEQIYYVDRAEGRGFTGFDGGGLVVSLGADIPFLGFDVLGLAGSVASSRFDEKLGEDLPVTRTALGIDLYGAKKLGKLSIDARGGIATVSSSSSRNVEINDVRRNFEGDWEGSQTSAHARVQYEFGLGNFEIIPLASVDYLSISEDGYTEDNPDNSLALSVDDRDGESLRVNSGLTLALTRRRGPSNLFSPGTVGFNETTMRYAFTAGTSFELASDPLSATYRYNDGESFTLEAELEETSYFGGLDATYSNGAINFTGGIYGNFGEDTTIGSLRFSLGAIW
ncbi:MAG: autotransporter outer membrane beta-barrel domain-containing protein, partial [Pseudomonadota bacterium]